MLPYRTHRPRVLGFGVVADPPPPIKVHPWTLGGTLLMALGGGLLFGHWSRCFCLFSCKFPFCGVDFYSDRCFLWGPGVDCYPGTEQTREVYLFLGGGEVIGFLNGKLT